MTENGGPSKGLLATAEGQNAGDFTATDWGSSPLQR
ncbi:MAG: hypothetical protein ACI8Y4_000551 [Candidatus Poriferisodalaceae bacterium]|jgi:hypothetical protein